MTGGVNRIAGKGLAGPVGKQFNKAGIRELTLNPESKNLRYPSTCEARLQRGSNISEQQWPFSIDRNNFSPALELPFKWTAGGRVSELNTGVALQIDWAFRGSVGDQIAGGLQQ